jgi:hypothetical protein
MDPWILLRLPILVVGLFVRRFGWKPLLIGWPVVILGILTYEFAQ